MASRKINPNRIKHGRLRMKEETKLISFISKSCCLCQLKILKQDAAALEWVWQFMSECLTLDESEIRTESVSELYRRRNSDFSRMMRWLREKPHLLSIGNSLVSCFHLQWKSMLSRDENLTEGLKAHMSILGSGECFQNVSTFSRLRWPHQGFYLDVLFT